MSKAERMALEAYPPKYAQQKRNPRVVRSEKIDTHSSARAIYFKGYRQAEKDLELTWKDMTEIVKIANLLEIEWLNSTPWDGIRDWGFYKEVLKRFNKERKEK